MYTSVYLFVEIRFLTLLRLIYHFCRLLFADPFGAYPLRTFGARLSPSELGGVPPKGGEGVISGGHCGMWLTNENSYQFVVKLIIRGKVKYM